MLYQENEDTGKNAITKRDIQKAGQFARNQMERVHNNCSYIADYVEMYLNDQGLPYKNVSSEDYGVIHVRVGCDKTKNGDGLKHFIFRIRGYYVEGPYKDEDWIWVDAAFDQFCDENENWDISYGEKKNIDNVRIMRVATDPRVDQYDTLKIFG